MKKKEAMKKRKVANKRTKTEVVNIIDTSHQLDLPFAITELKHNDNDPRENYGNLISAIETASIFSCKPSNEYPKYDYRNYSDQIIPVRQNKDGIKTIQISAGRSNMKLANGKLETEYAFLDFNDELIFSVIVKLITLENIAVEAATEENTIDEDSEKIYSLVTTYQQLIEETAKVGKKTNYSTIKKSLQKLQSTVLEVEHENHTRVASMIDCHNIEKDQRVRDSKLVIQVSGLIADVIEENHSYHVYNHLTTYSVKKSNCCMAQKRNDYLS